MNYLGPLIDRNMKGYDVQAKKYLDYIDEHRKNVETAFRNLFSNPVISLADSKLFSIDKNWEKYVDRLEEDIKNHDLSKYTDEEFYAYRAKYNQTEEEKARYNNDQVYQQMVDEAIKDAWDHHYRNNYHHPMFWKCVEIIRLDEYGVPVEVNPNYGIVKQDPDDMTLIAILHMICDWEAMSIKFGGKTTDWYVNKAEDERKAMSENTRKLTKQILEYLYDVELPDSVL